MNTEGTMRRREGGWEDLSDFSAGAKSTRNMDFSLSGLAENGARQSARSPKSDTARPALPELGQPLSIGEVASVLGCSEWTVRQRYMRQGLPYLRTSATGKLVFFRGQVIDWILERQQRQKGGIR
jgi:AraC-like DNA-binding protein